MQINQVGYRALKARRALEKEVDNRW